VNWMQKNMATITMVAGLVTALAAGYEAYVESLKGQPITAAGVILAVGTALLGWAAKRPGDLTQGQAKELADKQASEVLRSVSMTPPARDED
jgi:tRNA U34 5-carboxymethylaminomethyl modifying enzyme MnmG/GidA